MRPISRGYDGRRQRRCRSVADHVRSALRAGFRILSAGPTPRGPLEKWAFSILRVLAGVLDWMAVGGGLGAVSRLDDFALAHSARGPRARPGSTFSA